MRRKTTYVVLVIGILLGACGFQKEQFLGDAALPAPTVGFAQATSLQDESSGAIQVVVRLSRASTETVDVNYRFTGGSATAEDYMGMDDTLSFAPGETERGIQLTIATDALEENDETIELTLSMPVGAELGTERHTITISAALLPRVNFTVGTSDAMEGMGAVTLDLTLDIAPLLASTVTIGVKSASTAAVTHDYMMPASTTVTFPINSQSQTLSIPITNDMVDEDNETVIFEIATTTNVVIGTTVNEHLHTIVNDDMPPTVSITTPSGMTTELNAGASTNVVVTVSLSGPSGKTVTVPLEFGAGTATENADYNYPSKTALQFNPNQNSSLSETTKTFTIAVTGDVIDELDQTIVTSLMATTAPTNATLAMTNLTHTQTIMDDDMSPTVQFMTANQTVGEGDSGTTTTSYVCQLSQASEKAIAFDIILTGPATIPMDYTTVPADVMNVVTINIAAGATTGQIDLVVVGEMDVEGQDETIVMDIAAPLVNVRAAAANQRRTHTIRDQDPN